MRGKETVRDMVLSLAAIGVVAAAIYLFGIPHDEGPKGSGVKTVNYRVELATARRAAPYPVAAPEPGSLPKGWRATSVTYRPAAAEDGALWHLGFLDENEEYIAVEQSDGKPVPFVEEVTQQARETKRTQRIDGKDWVRYDGDKYDALVRAEPGVTTVVTGTASYGQLTKMAEALTEKKG
ncbi:DUF4245 domain-containing protein [Streptomyces sp. DSM 41524]|uniref:DUF4245 domain-containing protein n=2 Tax=Streptomyces violaceusniger group TaxID=2839105 RepID=A0A6G4AKH1_9ACTN|nr:MULTISPECIES: DUF4245 domain-containing protein [Streptomyces]MBA6441064.1 DUF4245 domain-containing protein [Streptomyces sp. GMR22]MEE4594824.1 DUF4245 domain-containing protein [Streptomyces sp. DSM 41524]NEW72997.1 DUF4245 domain-containing protein [Streptomyces rhizosphaericus]